MLARYLEADGKLPEAVRAADKAIEIDPRSIPAWTLAARVRESAGSLADAADALRRLAEIDRRNRTEHLTGIARLEARLGRVEPAFKAGRDLLAAAPGNPESYEFFAQLCFQLGRPEEGLDALRRAVRANPTEPRSCSGWPRPWPASIRPTKPSRCTGGPSTGPTTSITSSTSCASSPSSTSSAASSTGSLPGLQHQERDDRPAGRTRARGRDVAMCVAQAYASSGDLGSARAELERLLATDTRDTRLLHQLSKLAEEEGDLETAARYQKLHEELAPSDEGQARLASLLAKSGDLEEAQAVWSKAAAGKSQSFRVFQAMDNLLSNGKPLPVLEITEAMLASRPAATGKHSTARGWPSSSSAGPRRPRRGFEKLIDLPVGDDEKSALRQGAGTQPAASGRRAHRGRSSAAARQSMMPLEELASALRIRSAVSASCCPAALAARLYLVAGRLRAGPNGGPGLAR